MNCPKCGYEIAEGGEYSFSLVKKKEKLPVVPNLMEIKATKKYVCAGCSLEIKTNDVLVYKKE